jgi:hypothetical protein
LTRIASPPSLTEAASTGAKARRWLNPQEGEGQAPRAAPPPLGEFRIGRVLRRAFTINIRHPWVFLPLGILPALPYLGFPWWHPDGWAAALTLDLLVNLMLETLAQAMAVQAAFQAMLGRKVRLPASVATGLSQPGAVLAATLCGTIIVLVGLVLLVVPGLVAGARLYATLPACVIERRGAIASLRRSAELTRPYRWRVFALALLMVVVQAIGTELSALILWGNADAPGKDIWRFLWMTLVSSFEAVIAVVIYHDLRVARDGVQTDRIAAVFD